MQLQKQIDDLLARRASEWVEVLRTGGEAERADFVDWLSESRLHVQEYLEAVAVDRELDALDARREEDVEALLGRIAPNVVELERHNDDERADSRTRPGKLLWWGLAAGLCVFALGMAVYRAAHVPGAQDFTTRVGEQRTLELLDASVVHLNADSEIEVRFDESRRNVRLLQGEAFFKVAQDPARPFTVATHAGTIEVLGTQFNVYEQMEDTRISVVDGKVRVSPAAGAAHLLGPGEEIILRRDGSAHKSEHANLDRATAWRQRRLVFDNAPLEELVREFNRYNAVSRIELLGVAPGSHHYDGIFDADDPASLAQLLMRENDLVVERHGQKIIIRPALSPAGR